MAEGVPGFYLHLHVLWRTTGKTREPSSCSLYIICHHPEEWRAWLNAFFDFIRAGDARTAEDQVVMSMSVCCSLSDMETTHCAK